MSDYTNRKSEKGDRKGICQDREDWYCDKRRMRFPYGTKICWCHLASNPCDKDLQQTDCQCTCECPYDDGHTALSKDLKLAKEHTIPVRKEKSKDTSKKKNCGNDYIVKTKVKIRKSNCK